MTDLCLDGILPGGEGPVLLGLLLSLEASLQQEQRRRSDVKIRYEKPSDLVTTVLGWGD